MIRRNFEQIFKFSERLWFTKKRHLKKNTMSQPTLNLGEKSVQRCRTNKFLTIKVFKLKFNSHLLPSWFITHLVKKSEEEKNKPQLSERSGNSLKVEITAKIKKFLHLQYSTVVHQGRTRIELNILARLEEQI